jgi:hypothetical protein
VRFASGVTAWTVAVARTSPVFEFSDHARTVKFLGPGDVARNVRVAERPVGGEARLDEFDEQHEVEGGDLLDEGPGGHRAVGVESGVVGANLGAGGLGLAAEVAGLVGLEEVDEDRQRRGGADAGGRAFGACSRCSCAWCSAGSPPPPPARACVSRVAGRSPRSSGSGRTRQTKTNRTTKGWANPARPDRPPGGPTATIRLPVHPLYGERVEILARYGRHGLRVEQPDGQLRVLPVAWTDLVPRATALAVRGQPVRLAPEALRELGAWVAARIDGCRSPEKLDFGEAHAPELKLDAAPTDGAAGKHRDGAALTLVGQAGPSRAGGRSQRQKRGRP